MGLYDRGVTKIFRLTVLDATSGLQLSEQTIAAPRVHVVHGMSPHELRLLSVRVVGAVVNLPTGTTHTLEVLPFQASSLSADQYELLTVIEGWGSLRADEMAPRERENVKFLVSLGLVSYSVLRTEEDGTHVVELYKVSKKGEQLLRGVTTVLA